MVTPVINMFWACLKCFLLGSTHCLVFSVNTWTQIIKICAWLSCVAYNFFAYTTFLNSCCCVVCFLWRSWDSFAKWNKLTWSANWCLCVVNKSMLDLTENYVIRRPRTNVYMYICKHQQGVDGEQCITFYALKVE